MCSILILSKIIYYFLASLTKFMNLSLGDGISTEEWKYLNNYWIVTFRVMQDNKLVCPECRMKQKATSWLTSERKKHQNHKQRL